jgi:hypothetical protein
MGRDMEREKKRKGRKKENRRRRRREGGTTVSLVCLFIRALYHHKNSTLVT